MKIKFLTLLSKEEVDYTSLLVEILSLKKVRWYHTFYFIRTFKKIHREVEVFRNLDPLKIEEVKDCKIVRPKDLELIPYGAMVELRMLMQNPSKKEIGELIIETISIACYNSHTKSEEFDSDSDSYKEFVKLVSEQEVVSMLGLHNWIFSQNEKSIEKWNKLFTGVQVFDKDWDDAGGALMGKFDVLSTIKASCTDFNIDYKGAINLSFGLVQANTFSRMTSTFIQDKMRQTIQRRMQTESKH